MWTFRQAGRVIEDQAGKVCGAAYSGHGEGLNNPSLQDVRAGCRYQNGMWIPVEGLSQEDFGPLPRGIYTMQPPVDSPKLGPYVLQLIPSHLNEMFNRSGFFIHGDSVEFPGEFLASDGCIIAQRSLRELMWNSTDNRIQIIQ